MSKIEPKILKGFRDFLPEKQIARQKMIETIKASFEMFGFEPLETPAIEYSEILTGKYGDEGDKLMYRFRDNGDRDVALRYDLTIPLARVVAMNGELKKPFKRYQISPVWRAENTQKGRFREFYQCDADVVGSTNPISDAEVLALAANTLCKLGLKNDDFVIRINSREIISIFYDSLGLSPEQKVLAIRAVDKIYKIGNDAMKEEMIGGGISTEQAESISQFATSNGTPAEIKAAFEKLSEIIKKAEILAPGAKFNIDFSIARGLDYYTGLIFEATLAKSPESGSIAAGGRYDNLVGVFSNKSIPAVGLSIGLDRLIPALEDLKLMPESSTVIQAMVVNFDESLTDEYLKMSSQLRSANINTMLYYETADLKKQLAYASDRGIPYAIMYGPNEAKDKVVMIKDLQKGTQEKVNLVDLMKYFSK